MSKNKIIMSGLLIVKIQREEKCYETFQIRSTIY